MMISQIRSWPGARRAAAVAGAIVVALLVGVPTDVLPTPLFTRMTPVLWWNYPVWLLTAVLSGILMATYVRAPNFERHLGQLFGGGLLGLFAVGCPVCNKLVVLVLGFSGALNWFAPLQPLLALVSLGLLAFAVVQRLRGETQCDSGRAELTS